MCVCVLEVVTGGGACVHMFKHACVLMCVSVCVCVCERAPVTVSVCESDTHSHFPHQQTICHQHTTHCNTEDRDRDVFTN